MKTAVKVGGFGVGVVALFGAGLGVGHLSGVTGATSAAPGGAHGLTHGSSQGMDSSSGMDHGGQTATTIEPVGLAVTQDGFSLHLNQSTLPAATASTLSFTIKGPDGVVTRYTKTHDRELHLIVVRRDLSSFQHVHPTRAADGTWSVPLTLDSAGPYKVFADFAPAGRTDALVLATDLTVPGSYTPTPVGEDTTKAVTGGDTVTLDGSLKAGSPSPLTLEVKRDGQPVTLQPYLGAFGHLVVIRTGDLAYLHVHPTGDGLRFVADVPSAGTYRAFLDYQHNDVVRTAPFTVTAN
jgi:hypothetical protein